MNLKICFKFAFISNRPYTSSDSPSTTHGDETRFFTYHDVYSYNAM